MKLKRLADVAGSSEECNESEITYFSSEQQAIFQRIYLIFIKIKYIDKMNTM